MREHPYRAVLRDPNDTVETTRDLRPMEDVVVGGVLVSVGALGLVLGLVRPDCILEAGFGVLLLVLGLATLLGARRNR